MKWNAQLIDRMYLCLSICLVLAGGLFALAGCGSPAPLALRGATMGTTYEIKLAANPRAIDPSALQADIDALLEAVNDQMSTYRSDSEICRFNRTAADEWFPVSRETAEVVAIAQDVSRASDGALDVTVGPLVRLWSFGPPDTTNGDGSAAAAERNGRTAAFAPPAEASIAAARETVGFQRLEARQDPPALRKQIERLEIDLSAVAQGFGVDQVAQLLDKRGLTGYMVEIGGEVRAKGRRLDGRPWQIGIERPADDRRELLAAVPLSDASLATSGDYRNYHESAGRRFPHILDPSTGRPVDHALASVSVLADSCAAADAWATALMVLGPERGYNCANEHGVAALFVTRTDDGFAERMTAAWTARLGKMSQANATVGTDQ
jgi:thiamine biosynthesis lipoprotein